MKGKEFMENSRSIYVNLTSVRRIHGKRISDAELTIIFRKAQQAKASSQSYQSSTSNYHFLLEKDW